MAIIDNLQKISGTVWELPATYKEGMRVPARIVATEKLVRDMDEAVYQQISNVATLPGITRYALCMPDGHSGYGFPIGGVAAMDVHEGGDASKISERAIDRGYNQVGTLGSGNHYLEVQVARPEDVRDKQLAKKFGINIPNQVVVMFHCGSHGFGHQVATDYLQIFLKVMESKYSIKILDRELACAPFESPEGRDYFAAMKCGLNMSFANRQVILHRIREVFSEVFGRSAQDLGLRMIYDVAHNTAKLERHIVDGK